MIALAALALVALSVGRTRCLQEEAPAPPGAAQGTPPPVVDDGALAAEPAAPELDFQRDLDLAGLRAELERLEAAHPELVSLGTLGTSAGDRDILVATVSDERTGEPGEKPALVLLTDLEPSAPGAAAAGPGAELFAVRSLVERAAREEPLAELLRRTTVYAIAAPDPDALATRASADAAAPEAARVNLNRNFPIGWEPFPAAEPGRKGASGAYPLSDPTSLALARFLLARTNVAGVVVSTLRPAGADACAGGEAHAAHRFGASEALEHSLCARAWIEREPGSLPRFCRERLACPVLCVPAWDGELVTSAIGRAPRGFVDQAELVVRLLTELPRLEATLPEVERLRADLWKVELSIRTLGALAPGARGHRAAPGVRLVTSGAELDLVAVRKGAGGAFTPLEGPLQNALLGSFEGGESLTVRLVVRAPEGTPLEIAVRSPCAGEARTSALLR